MTDDKSQRGEPDRSKINTSEHYEVEYWSRKFNCSTQQLREAVKKVGNSPGAVKAALGGK